MPASNNLAVDFEPEVSSSSMEGAFQFNRPSTSMANTTILIYTTYLSSLSTMAKELISRVQTYKTLTDNWDSYGAVPPNQDCIERAVAFIKKADGNLLPLYFVAPGPNGEIVIEFRKDNKEAAAYIHPDGSTELLLHEGNNFILEGTVEADYKKLLSYLNG